MAIQGSGQIKLTELATEFGGTAPYSLKAYYRSGGRVPANNTNVPASGAIGLKNFYNAVNRVTAVQTFATNTTQTALNVSTLPGYVAGITDVTVYVSSNVYVYSTDTATPALTISGATAGDTITLVNNGYIIGKGGQGGNGNSLTAGTANGFNAGPALNLGNNITLTNNSYIAGGGGGGGGSVGSGGGGGAGGGQGGNNIASSGSGGAGGAVGASGSMGTTGSIGNFTQTTGGGGGGRILPGVGGTLQDDPFRGGSGGGAGGGGGPFLFTNPSDGQTTTGTGYAGGSANNAATNPPLAPGNFWGQSAGGGGWGAAGGTVNQSQTGGQSGPKGTGGSGGKAINLNGYTVTYITAGTVYGAVS